jgi:hypothetical protein
MTTNEKTERNAQVTYFALRFICRTDEEPTREAVARICTSPYRQPETCLFANIRKLVLSWRAEEECNLPGRKYSVAFAVAS